MWGGVVARLFSRRNKGPSCADSPLSRQDRQRESQDGNRKSSAHRYCVRRRLLVFMKRVAPDPWSSDWGSHSSDVGGLAGGRAVAISPWRHRSGPQLCPNLRYLLARRITQLLVRSPAIADITCSL